MDLSVPGTYVTPPSSLHDILIYCEDSGLTRDVCGLYAITCMSLYVFRNAHDKIFLKLRGTPLLLFNYEVCQPFTSRRISYIQ